MKIWIFSFTSLMFCSIAFGMNPVMSPFEIKDIVPKILDPVLKIITDYVIEQPYSIKAGNYGLNLKVVDFTPDNKKLVFESAGDEIKIWDLQTGKLFKVFKGSKASLSPDGTKLVSSPFSKGSPITLRDIKSGDVLREFPGHEKSIRAINFSPDGTKIASVSENIIKIWDVQTGNLLNTLKVEEWFYPSVVFSPDSTQIASSDGKTVKLFDVKKGKELRTFPREDMAYSIRFSLDGDKLAVGGHRGDVELWDVQTGKTLHKLPHGDDTIQVNFSPDGTQLVTGSESKGKIRIWDVQTGKLLNTYPVNAKVTSVGFSPDGRMLAFGTQDNQIKIFIFQVNNYLKDLMENTKNESKRAQLALLVLIAGAIREKRPLALSETWMIKAANAFPDYMKLALKGLIYREKKSIKRKQDEMEQ